MKYISLIKSDFYPATSGAFIAAVYAPIGAGEPPALFVSPDQNLAAIRAVELYCALAWHYRPVAGCADWELDLFFG
jgi:hypothetical protein